MIEDEVERTAGNGVLEEVQALEAAVETRSPRTGPRPLDSD
jgi:hypothetical protein